MLKLISKEQATENVFEYIFQHEHEDFIENPSDNHVYYSALLAKYGQEYADIELKVASEEK